MQVRAPLKLPVWFLRPGPVLASRLAEATEAGALLTVNSVPDLTACRLGFLTVIVASPVPLTFPLLHKVWIARPHEAFLFRLAECSGTKVRAALALGLSLLWLERMLHHVCIRP